MHSFYVGISRTSRYQRNVVTKILNRWSFWHFPGCKFYKWNKNISNESRGWAGRNWDWGILFSSTDIILPWCSSQSTCTSRFLSIFPTMVFFFNLTPISLYNFRNMDVYKAFHMVNKAKQFIAAEMLSCGFSIKFYRLVVHLLFSRWPLFFNLKNFLM